MGDTRLETALRGAIHTHWRVEAIEILRGYITDLRRENKRLEKQVEGLRYPWKNAVSAADIEKEARRAAFKRAAGMARRKGRECRSRGWSVQQTAENIAIDIESDALSAEVEKEQGDD